MEQRPGTPLLDQWVGGAVVVSYLAADTINTYLGAGETTNKEIHHDLFSAPGPPVHGESPKVTTVVLALDGYYPYGLEVHYPDAGPNIVPEDKFFLPWAAVLFVKGTSLDPGQSAPE